MARVIDSEGGHDEKAAKKSTPPETGKGWCTPHPLGILYELKTEGLTKWAIRNLLIPKETTTTLLGAGKRKSGKRTAALRDPQIYLEVIIAWRSGESRKFSRVQDAQIQIGVRSVWRRKTSGGWR
jgi:hypothetical protein